MSRLTRLVTALGGHDHRSGRGRRAHRQPPHLGPQGGAARSRPTWSTRTSSPSALVAQMREMGLFGATIPEAYGGLELDTLTYARVVEELAFGWMSLSGVLNTHMIGSNLIKRFGTDEQKQKWLPKMAAGEVRGAFSLSEPDAGSDTKAIRCKATPDGETYVIDGTKMWVTNGERAGIVALAAVTPEGITCFIVEKEPGPKLRGHLGQPQHRQARLQGHRDGRDGLRGPPGAEGQRPRRRRVAGSGAAADPQLARARSGQRRVAGRRGGQGRVRGRHLLRPAARDVRGADRRRTRPSSSSWPTWPPSSRRRGCSCTTRPVASTTASGPTSRRAWPSCSRRRPRSRWPPRRCASTAATATPPSCPIERYYRDAPLMIIGEGTNEIQRMVIARGLLSRYALDESKRPVTYVLVHGGGMTSRFWDRLRPCARRCASWRSTCRAATASRVTWPPSPSTTRWRRWSPTSSRRRSTTRSCSSPIRPEDWSCRAWSPRSTAVSRTWCSTRRRCHRRAGAGSTACRNATATA